MLRAICLDISGVLYVGDEAVPGAVDALNKLQEAGLMVRLVTNTSRKTSQKVAQDLQGMGFSISHEKIYTAPKAAHDYLQTQKLRPYCLIDPAIQTEFSDLPQSDFNAVFIADAGDGFTYQSLNRAFQLCMNGCPLIAIGDNKYFREGGNLQLDAGPFIKAIEYASGQTAIVCGKPATAFYQQVLANLNAKSENLKPKEVLMIGDDVIADVQGAMSAGLQACLVKTEKYLPGDENRVKGAMLADSVLDAVQTVLRCDITALNQRNHLNN